MTTLTPSTMTTTKSRRRLHRSTSVRRVALVAAVGLTVIGCRKNEQRTTGGEGEMTLAEMLRPRRPVVAGTATIVADGPLPLVYLTVDSGAFRIIDLTAQRVLADVTASDGQIIAIDAETGVRVGGRPVQTGPLQADHRYGIALGPRVVAPPATTQPTETSTTRPTQNSSSGARDVAPPRPLD